MAARKLLRLSLRFGLQALPSPSLGPSIVVHDLQARVCADHEDFGALHDDDVDEDSLASLDFAKTDALVDKPPIDNHVHDFGLVRESFCEAGFVLFVLLLFLLFLHPIQPPPTS